MTNVHVKRHEPRQIDKYALKEKVQELGYDISTYQRDIY